MCVCERDFSGQLLNLRESLSEVMEFERKRGRRVGSEGGGGGDML